MGVAPRGKWCLSRGVNLLPPTTVQLALAGFLLVGTVGRASTVHVGNTAAALDLARQFAAVGWVDTKSASGFSTLSSGVGLNPEWFLSAGHSSGSAENTRVGFGDNAFADLGGGNYVEVSEIYVLSSEILERDLALYHMVDVAPSLFPNATLFEGELALGDLTTAVGYGLFTEVGGSARLTGNRAAYSSRITEFGFADSPDYFLMTTFFGPEDPGFDPLGGASNQGDSGGGVFVEGGDGTMQLAAIHSHGYGDKTAHGSRSGSLRLSDHQVRNWLYAITSEHSQDPANIIPEAHPVLLLAAAVWLALRRRGRAG